MENTPSYKRITAKAAEELLKAHNPDLAGQAYLGGDEYVVEEEEYRVRLYEGDTVFDSNFSVGASTVLVDGNLTVGGFLSDCDGQDSTQLIVLGDVRAVDLMARGEVIIGGDVEVARLAYLNSLNDLAFMVFGHLRAHALVEEGMYTWVGKTITARYTLSLHNKIRQGDALFVERRGSNARDLFLPDFLDDNYPLMNKIFEAQAAGKLVTR